MIKKQRILDRIQTIKDNVNDIEEIKEQYETPIEVDKQVPRNS